MKYIVIVQDRHSDLECEYSDLKETAIERAKELAKKYCRYDSDYRERYFDKGPFWFYAEYSCESDMVGVYEAPPVLK